MRDETPSRSGPYLCRSYVMWKMTNISALDVFYQRDGRENRCIREVLEWYRGEDAGDLERSELNELVENWRHLNDSGRKIGKLRGKIGKVIRRS